MRRRRRIELLKKYRSHAERRFFEFGEVLAKEHALRGL